MTCIKPQGVAACFGSGLLKYLDPAFIVLRLFYSPQTHGPQTLFMVHRLFSWSTDSFLVHRLVYSPLAGLYFVDLVVDGQHQLAGRVVVNLTC